MEEDALANEEEEIIGEEYAPDIPQDATRDEDENNDTPQEDTQDASNEASENDNAPPAQAVEILTVEDVEKMKVIELSDALKKRNQSTRGNKPELKERLLAAIVNNAPLVTNQDANRVDNMAGESFNHHAYWKLMSNENGEEMPDDRAAM